MKKLLITTDCFLPRWDGIARFINELLPFLTKEFEVTIACPEFPGRMPEIPGVKIHRYPLLKIRFGDIYFAWTTKKGLLPLVEQSDIVLNQTLGTIGLSAIKAAKKLDTPLISYVHTIEWELAARAIKYGKFITETIIRMIAKNAYNKCDILVTSSAEMRDLLTLNGIKTRKEIVPLGVNPELFRPPQSKKEAKQKIGIQPDTLVVGFVGRIAREKDLGTLLKAFRRIQHKHNAKLLIVGTGIEDKKFKNPRIILAGQTDNVVPYLQAMDVFVLPSLMETSSLATMEAMSCGLPVIATPVGSIKEYVEDGVNGFFFPRKNIDVLAEKLHALLKSEAVRQAIGNEARETMTKRGSWNKTAQSIITIIRELTS
jgi:glycosyltransferase involved in cell wall biosynthesis